MDEPPRIRISAIIPAICRFVAALIRGERLLMSVKDRQKMLHDRNLWGNLIQISDSQ